MNEDITMKNTANNINAVNVAPKVREPDVFRGERNALMVESWIESMELYFQLIRVDHGQDQLLYALSLLRDDAQLWYSQLKVYETERLPQDWSDFKVLLRKEFIPVNAIIQARDKLASLVQRGTVSNYINEFRRLKLQIPDLSHGDALDRFVRGLAKAIRVAVRSRFSSTLAEAESLALAIEAAAQEEEGVVAPRQFVQPRANYDPMDLDSLRETVNALVSQVRQQTNYRRTTGDSFRNGGSRFGSGPSNNGSLNGTGLRCYGCGGIGHMKRECPTYLNRSQKNKGGNQSTGDLKA